MLTAHLYHGIDVRNLQIKPDYFRTKTIKKFRKGKSTQIIGGAKNSILIHQIIDDVKKMYIRDIVIVQYIYDGNGKLLIGADLFDAWLIVLT